MNTLKPKGSILLVDPEPAILMILSSILRDTAKYIETARSGAEALELIRDRPFDALLCELVMPQMNGIELVSVLALESKLIPTILVTRYVEKTNMLRALQAGAVDFVEKPFHEKLVKLAARNAMDHRNSFSKAIASEIIAARKTA